MRSRFKIEELCLNRLGGLSVCCRDLDLDQILHGNKMGVSMVSVERRHAGNREQKPFYSGSRHSQSAAE